jgi:hypothetical protein
MEKFTGTSDDVHDDIVSAISLLVDQFGAYADMDNRVNSVNQDYVSNQKSQQMHDMIYCLGRYAKFSELGPIDESPSTTFQRENNPVSQAVSPYDDPLSDLYN